MIVGITGGTGFVGRHLTRLLTNNGHSVIVFTRSKSGRKANGIEYAHWDPAKQECDLDAIKKPDAMVHLAGTNVNRRWTSKAKADIYSSRVDGTRFLVSVLKREAPNCKTFIAASAMGYYGADNGSEPFVETEPAANNFLGNTCRQWEEESLKATETMRTVICRFGIVWGREDGAFPQLAMPVSLGVKPIFGDGSQIMSWIHVDDLASLLYYGITNVRMAGVFNAVSPEPVSQKELMKAIANGKQRWALPIPVPSLALKLVLGEMSTEILKSCTVSAEKTLNTGFTFRYPTVQTAVNEILRG